MPIPLGDLGLLEQPVSKELLHSTIPARLAYVWTDGTPRVVAIWFHSTGRDLVLATPPKAPKPKGLVKSAVDPWVRRVWNRSTEPCRSTPLRPSAISDANRARPG